MRHDQPSSSAIPVRLIDSLLSVLASTWLGLAILASIVAYLTLASVVPQMPIWLDRTPTGVYLWWPHALLWVALAVNIALATVLRVPLRPEKLGVWLAHAGVLLVIGGAFWYFHQKIDGDIVVPRTQAGLFMPVNFFYDGDEKIGRALYVTAPDAAGRPQTIQSPLPGLPLGRTREDLSLPVQSPDARATVRVTGYQPHAYVEPRWNEGGPASQPAAQVNVQWGQDQGSLILVPGTAGVDAPELTLRYMADLPASELERLAAPGPAAHQLSIRVPARGFHRDLPVRPGQSIDLPELGYHLEVVGFHPQWRMRGQESDKEFPALRVLVTRLPASGPASQPTTQPGEFLRLIVSGREDLTTDVATTGHSLDSPRPGDLLDKDLVLSYTLNAAAATDRDAVILATGEGYAPTLVWLSPDGTRGRFAAPVGTPVQIFPDQPGPARSPHGGQPGLTLTLERLLTHAYSAGELADTPPDMAPQDPGPAVRVEVAGKGWKLAQWVPFVYDAHLDHEQMQTVRTPQGEEIQLQFSRLQHPLGATLQVENLTYQTYPGTGTPRDYICRLRTSEAASPDQWRTVDVHLNQPTVAGGFRISQQGWDSEDPFNARYTRLGVANRPGIGAIWLGCFLICVALPYSFYIKPLLRRRRERQTATVTNDSPASVGAEGRA